MDGQNPQAGLVEGSDGALYGTTQYGGAYNAGVVFRVNKDGTGYGVLYKFGGGADGANPQSGLVEAGNGALYGTTPSGGDYGSGTVFRLNKDSTGYGVMHSFGGSATDGQQPQASLTRGSDGVLYGTTAFGGGQGAIDCVWRYGAKVVSDGRHMARDRCRARFRAAMARLLA